jgi:hypothetical protein
LKDVGDTAALALADALAAGLKRHAASGTRRRASP